MRTKAPGKAFRKGISLKQILRMFPDNATAEQWFIEQRWADGMCCPRCGSVNVQTGTKHPTMPFRCREKACAKFFSVKTGTIMEGSKIGYQDWIIATFQMLTSLKSQGDTWYLDELFVRIQGQQQYLWRAVDEDGDVLDILVQSRRNHTNGIESLWSMLKRAHTGRAATRFFRKLLKRQGREPRRLITDKLRSYSAAHRTVMPSVIHSTQQYEKSFSVVVYNRAEVSHQSTRQRERQMRRFRSAAHLQRFASVHGVVQNLFRVGRLVPFGTCSGQLTTVS